MIQPAAKLLITQFLTHFLLWFFAFWSVVGIALGVGLIVYRARTLETLRWLNGWISTQRVLEPAEVPRSIEPLAHRYRVPLGIVLIVCGGFLMLDLLVRFDVGAAASAFHQPSTGYGRWLIESVKWLIVAGAAAAALLGILLCFFPSRLEAIESRMNKWVSLRDAAGRGDTMHVNLDRLVEIYPRATGAVIAAGAFVVLIETGFLLFGRS